VQNRSVTLQAQIRADGEIHKNMSERQLQFYSTAKPRFIVSVGWSDKKKLWIWEDNRCGSLYKSNKNDQICLYVFTKSKNVHK
jgi:hypothetical protein